MSSNSTAQSSMLDRRPAIDRHTSLAFAWLQTILTLLVVTAHLYSSYDIQNGFRYVANFSGPCISIASIAGFFFMSGYLFFAKFEKFGKQEYLYALRSRIKTLLIPFLLWSIIAYSINALFYHNGWVDFPFYQPPYRLDLLLWSLFTGTEIITIGNFTLHGLSFPGAHFVLWYILDLMLIILFTPLIWWAVKRLKLYIIPLLLIILFYYGHGPHRYYHVDWIFFPIGAAFAICRTDIKKLFYRIGPISLIVSMIMLCIYTYMYTNFDAHHIEHGPKSFYFICVLVVVLLIAQLYLAFRATQKIADTPSGAPLRHSITEHIISIAPYTFFIYVTHDIHTPNVLILNTLLPLKSIVGATIFKIIEMILYIPVRFYLCYLIARLMQRYTPRLLALLTGSRINRNFLKS